MSCNLGKNRKSCENDSNSSSDDEKLSIQSNDESKEATNKKQKPFNYFDNDGEVGGDGHNYIYFNYIF